MRPLEMLRHAVSDLGFPGRWVVGDEVYGGSVFRAEVAKLELKYVLAVSCTDTVKKVFMLDRNLGQAGQEIRKRGQPDRTFGHSNSDQQDGQVGQMGRRRFGQ